MLNLKALYIQISNTNNKENKNKWYFAPLIPSLLWILLSVLSIFTIDISVISSPFVIISILSRLLLSFFSVVFIKKFYITRKLKLINYNHLLNFIGYSISITYVSYMLPGVVLDFYQSGQSTFIFTFMVFLSTLCPIVLYLLLKSAKVKLASSYFNEKEVLQEKKMKKDKALKKANQRLLRADRSFIQNAWFEVLDPLLWAILWVLIINNTLFQLYQIPSSSMVPTFLEQDRVVASKLLSGPGIPLTKYHLPEIVKPKVGDIVTFNNPKVDDLNSDLHYKNVFTRIFQPFVFMLTFSKLDIDTDESGRPKARQLVKRTIGVPGEKICMVNDKVYKKTATTNWTLMSEIEGQKEWGRADLFELDSKNSGAQIINPKIREDLDKGANLVFDSNIDDLESLLSFEKEDFLKNLNYINKVDFLNTLITYGTNNNQRISEIQNELERFYYYMMQVNKADIPNSDKHTIVDSFNSLLERYYLVVLSDKVNDLRDILQMDTNTISVKLNTKINVNNNSSPYDIFTNKLEALNTLKTLKLYNMFLTQNKIDYSPELVEEIKLLSLYIEGLQFKDHTRSFFGAGNLPEFPLGENNYIPNGEYFLLGDNRYNSLDTRMGDINYDLPLTDNNNLFSQTINVGWEPHTINEKYIHGKVRVIIFPFNHFKLFSW